MQGSPSTRRVLHSDKNSCFRLWRFPSISEFVFQWIFSSPCSAAKSYQEYLGKMLCLIFYSTFTVLLFLFPDTVIYQLFVKKMRVRLTSSVFTKSANLLYLEYDKCKIWQNICWIQKWEEIFFFSSAETKVHNRAPFLKTSWKTNFQHNSFFVI